MRFFHRPSFAELARTYAPPIGIKTYHAEDFGEQIARHGATTILLRCTHEQCGKIKKVVMLGKSTEADVLERMIR